MKNKKIIKSVCERILFLFLLVISSPIVIPFFVLYWLLLIIYIPVDYLIYRKKYYGKPFSKYILLVTVFRRLELKVYKYLINNRKYKDFTYDSTNNGYIITIKTDSLTSYLVVYFHRINRNVIKDKYQLSIDTTYINITKPKDISF